MFGKGFDRGIKDRMLNDPVDLKNSPSVIRVGFRIICVVMLILLFALLRILLKEPSWIEHPIQVRKKILYFLILMFALGFVFRAIERKFGKISPGLHLTLLAVYSVAYVFAVMHLGRDSVCMPLNDSGSLSAGAKFIAGITDEMSWTYFSRWHNNIPALFFLGMIYRCGVMAGVSDLPMFVAFTNLIQVVVALVCIFLICRKVCGTYYSGWIGVLCFTLYPVTMGFSLSQYTDAFSLCFGILAALLWIYSGDDTVTEKDGKKSKSSSRLLPMIISGLLWALGGQIKATVLISFVAVLIWTICFRPQKKNLLSLLIPGLVIVFVAVIMKLIVAGLPVREYDQAWGTPLVPYYLGLGMEADGAFHLDSPIFNGIGATPGMKEKSEYAWNYVWKNRSALTDPEHIKAKALVNFATGTLNVMDFFWDDDPDSKGILFHMMSWDGGETRVTFFRWATGYWYALLFLYTLGWLLLLLTKKLDALTFICYVSFLGIMVYVMLFEANSRQLYNHLPMLICCSAITLSRCIDVLAGLIGKIKRRTK